MTVAQNYAATGNAGVSSTGVGGASVGGIIPYSPAMFRKYNKALSNVRNGTADMRILCGGDSTVEGIGSTGSATLPNPGSWPTRLSQLLNTLITPAANGLVTAPTILGSGSDNRWSYSSSSWILASFGLGAGSSFTSAGPSTGTASCTPGVVADRYWVYFVAAPSVGTSLTFQATGGSAVVINPTTGYGNGIGRVSVSAASASAANVVTFACANGSLNSVLAVEPYLSTKKQILVGNGGVGGSTAYQWAANPGTGYYAPDTIKAIAPDLFIYCIGVNDATANIPTAQVVAEVGVNIDYAKLSGDVILLDMIPANGNIPTSPNPSYLSVQKAYSDGYKALAASKGVYFASIIERFGGAYDANFMNDNLHCNDQGYWDIAQYITEILRAN